MVKIGFIVEGDSEKLILESQAFKDFLSANQIDYVPEIVNAEGGGNLLPHNLKKYTQSLADKGANRFVILTDLETDPCVTETKNRISAPTATHSVIVSRKAIEAWYLADDDLMSKFFKKKYSCEFPEKTQSMPFDHLRAEFISHTGRGLSSSKPVVARRMINEGFTVENAAKHENCPSAQYFLNKIKEIAK